MDAKSSKSHKSDKKTDKSKSKDKKSEKSASKDKKSDKSQEKDKKKKEKESKDKKDKKPEKSEKSSKSKDKDKKESMEKSMVSAKSGDKSMLKSALKESTLKEIQQNADSVLEASRVTHSSVVGQDETDLRVCLHHHQEIVLFCESCEEPICTACTQLGPHNNSLHRINRLQEAFIVRAQRLHKQINMQLLEKKEVMIAQMTRLEYRIEEIRYVKRLIERYTLESYSGSISRLDQSQGEKMAALQHDMGQLQIQMDDINDIAGQYMRMTTHNADPVKFLCQAKQMYEMVENAITQSYKDRIDVNTNDLPKELTEQRLQFQQIKSNESIVRAKEEVAYECMKKQYVAKKQNLDQLNLKANIEINQWAKLTDKFATQLASYQIICFYCRVSFDINTVNTQCKLNRSHMKRGGAYGKSKLSRVGHGNAQQIVGFTLTRPDASCDGSGRHFFAQDSGRPVTEEERQKLLNARQNKQKTVHMQDIEQNKGQQTFFEVQLAKIRKQVVTNNVKLKEVFSSHDKTNSKFVNYIQFTYILSEILQVGHTDIDKITQFLDPSNTNKINYEELLKMIEDITYVTSTTINNQIHI